MKAKSQKDMLTPYGEEETRKPSRDSEWLLRLIAMEYSDGKTRDTLFP